MKPFVIYGMGDFADIVYDLITRDMGRDVAAFCVDDEYCDGMEEYKGYPLTPSSQLMEMYPPNKVVIAMGLIGKQMFVPRSKIYELLCENGYVLENVYAKGIELPEEIGNGNIIMKNVSFGYGVKLGNANIIWQGVVFPHHNQVGNLNNFGPTFSLSGYAKVGNHCYLGNNATVKNHTCVADYTFVGAGAYISKDTKEYQVVVPNRSYVLEGKRSTDIF